MPDSDTNSNSPYPTENELALMADGLLITKLKRTETNILPTYHQWQTVWGDNLIFRKAGSNNKLEFRAIAISYPMYWVDLSTSKFVDYRGYVCGLDIVATGGVKMYLATDIEWINIRS